MYIYIYLYSCYYYYYYYLFIIIIVCVCIKVIRIPLINIYRCGLYNRHHIYCTLVDYEVFVVCCNLSVSCLGSSNKFHSYIDVVTHVGDHFGKNRGRFSGGAAEREASSKNWDKQVGQQMSAYIGAIFAHYYSCCCYWVKALSLYF